MLNYSSQRIDRLLARWQRLTQRFALPIVLLAVACTAAALYYISNNLGINTDTEDMLSEDLSWRQTYTRYRENFPQYNDNIVVVVEGTTPDHALDASALLGARLRREKDLFEWVFQFEQLPFLRANKLLFLDVQGLEELVDRLASVQPLLSRLEHDQSLRGLFSVLNEALQHRLEGETVDLAKALDEIAAVVSAHSAGRERFLSWQQLMSGSETKPASNRTIILAKPKLDYSVLLPGESAVKAIREFARELGLTPENGITVRLTGGAALSYEELDSVSRGAGLAGILALVMVGIILFIGLRSVVLVLATLMVLIMGLIYTAAFATLAIGELNLISVAFAVLYIGLGVDYAIHFSLRYQELLSNSDKTAALADAGRHTGTSLLLCAVTTAIGFYAFVPTAYSGVAELGLISGTGMFISLLVTLTVQPALLYLLPQASLQRSITQTPPFLSAPTRHAGGLAIAATAIAIACGIFLPFAKFDHNPIHLMDPTTESVQTYRDLLHDSEKSPLSAVVTANSKEQLEILAQRLRALPAVDSVISIAQFVPKNQPAKLAMIDQLVLTMDTTFDGVQAPPPALREQLSAFRDLLLTLNRYADAFPDDVTAQQLRDSLGGFAFKLKNAPIEQRSVLLGKLERSLLGLLPGRLRELSDALNAREFAEADLPELLHRRWVSPSGVYRLEVFPREDLDDNHALQTFVEQIRTVAPDATDSPVVNLEASNAVISAFQQALITSVIAITLLLLVLIQHKKDVLFILLPLAFAALFTGTASILLGIPFNFANIIALPLLLGIGIDSAIHMLHRYRTDFPHDGILLGTSTARAILFSALTTACSFGNLAISSHAGTASMGIMLTAGILFTLICSLLILPGFLTLFSPNGPRTAT